MSRPSAAVLIAAPAAGRASIPSLKTALSLVGGASKLAKLRSETVSLATASVPTKLQLAVHIAQRHYMIGDRDDLSQSIRPSLGDPYEVENLAYLLNKQDGPWAIAVSRNSLTWQPVRGSDLDCLRTRGDFVEMVFHHLR